MGRRDSHQTNKKSIERCSFLVYADGGIPTGGSAAFQAGFGTKAPLELSKLLGNLPCVRIPSKYTKTGYYRIPF